MSNYCDFLPTICEAEPKFPKPDPIIAEQGRKCQRFDDESWKNVRYADVQKMFHATPVFSALKVNSILASTTPSWTSLSHLERTDTTLGAISHGLLLQRREFTEACKGLDSNTQKVIQRRFLNPDCQFRKITDGLLQYTCGRRAETFQSRRETYKSSNKVLNELLHDIPPSDTHLFSEVKLTEAIKNQGGVHKFFPAKNNYTFKTAPKNKPPTKRSHHTHPSQTDTKRRHYQTRKFRPPAKNAYSRPKPGPSSQDNAKKS